MRKVMRCLVLGAQRCGKSAILQELACVEDVLQRPYVPTSTNIQNNIQFMFVLVEDTYQIQTGVDSSDKPREIVIFHDTAGYSRGPIEIRRSYLAVADAFLLVYSVLNMDTFERIDALKKYIDKNLPKDKRELPIVVVGTMIDLPGRQVDIEMASTWASKERGT
jgi:NF-kappa-B inhibitor-interacting Ras-like protein